MTIVQQLWCAKFILTATLSPLIWEGGGTWNGANFKGVYYWDIYLPYIKTVMGKYAAQFIRTCLCRCIFHPTNCVKFVLFIFLHTVQKYTQSGTRKKGPTVTIHSPPPVSFAYDFLRETGNGTLYRCQLQHRDNTTGCSGTLTVTNNGEVIDRVQHSEQCSRHMKGKG